MRRYQEKFIQTVREIRKIERLSYTQLGVKFNVPPTTIRNWCHDIVGTKWDTLLISNEKKRQEFKDSELSVVPDLRLIDKNQGKLLASLLYGCEGSKYPAHRGISFANSDPKLILAFLHLLRRSFNLDINKFSIHLQVHTTQNYEALRKFWSGLLQLPKTCFIKPTITIPKGKKHREDYMGTCTLRYRDYRFQLKLLGIYEKFINSFSLLH